MSNTICWHCGHAYGGCSWSDYAIPVDGWDADKDIISYEVKQCPHFCKDKRLKTVDDDTIRILSAAVLEQTAVDYDNGDARVEEDVYNDEFQIFCMYEKDFIMQLLRHRRAQKAQNGLPVRRRLRG